MPLPSHTVLGFEGQLREVFGGLPNRFPSMAFTHDCSLIQIVRQEPVGHLVGQGIHGCTAWKRICFIAANLDVYGCSHEMGTETPVGNYRNASLEILWNKAEPRVSRGAARAGCESSAYKLKGLLCSPCPAVNGEEVKYCDNRSIQPSIPSMGDRVW